MRPSETVKACRLVMLFHVTFKVISSCLMKCWHMGWEMLAYRLSLTILSFQFKSRRVLSSKANRLILFTIKVSGSIASCFSFFKRCLMHLWILQLTVPKSISCFNCICICFGNNVVQQYSTEPSSIWWIYWTTYTALGILYHLMNLFLPLKHCLTQMVWRRKSRSFT